MRDAIVRSNVFESGVGRLLMWLVVPFFGVGIFVAVRVMAVADSVSVKALAIGAICLTLGHGLAWAVLLHPFHGADESEHFAYTEHLALAHEQPDRANVSARSPYSSAQLRLMEALHHNSTILNPSSRPRWDEAWQQRYELAVVDSPPRGDGGGGSESASGHSPLYYFVVGLPYRIMGERLSVVHALLISRVLNALLAACVAGLAVIAAANLLGPKLRRVAWLAGLTAGFQPVFGSVAGAVNNDTGVNLASALFVVLLLQLLRNGPSRKLACSIGAVGVAMPVLKITGFAVLPASAVVVVFAGARFGFLALTRWTLTATMAAALTAALWIFAVSPIIGGERGSLYNVHPVTATTPPPPRAPEADSLTRSVSITSERRSFQIYWQPTIGGISQGIRQ